MTDNGTATGASVFNAGMRGAKAIQFTGGTRVPSFWRWPGTLPSGVDVAPLTCHQDIFPTLVEITGAKVEEALKQQIQGRTLFPLLKDKNADWPNREFVTHVGRWAKGKAAESQHLKASIRDERWMLVFNNGPQGELFDLKSDPGEKTNVAAQHPVEYKRLNIAYDEWWKRVMPNLVNEDAVGPNINPFHAAYWKQFNGPGPNNVLPKK